MDYSIEIELVCSECGGNLCATQRGEAVYIEPCDTCMGEKTIEISNLENSVEELENKNSELESQIESLENQIDELNAGESI